MKSLLILILLLGGIMTFCSCEQSDSVWPSNRQTSFMHPTAQIDFVIKQLEEKKEPYQSAYQQMIRKADNALEESHHAVEDFSVPGYYQDPQGHSKGALGLQKDGFNAYACALAYRLDAGDQYGIKACEYINAWAKINKKYSDYDGELAMTDAGAGIVIAAQLMYGSDLWKKKIINYSTSG
ncbi:MAG: alginate lyase family protein [Dysgonomonas sp.]|nr:alginate lyase family protein [Dysgonomonas sp.]